jgi:hypothetical protein
MTLLDQTTYILFSYKYSMSKAFSQMQVGVGLDNLGSKIFYKGSSINYENIIHHHPHFWFLEVQINTTVLVSGSMYK